MPDNLTGYTQHRNRAWLLLLLLLYSAALYGCSDEPPALPSATAAGELFAMHQFAVSDFALGGGQNVSFLNSGVSVAADQQAAIFTTPVVTATIGFNYVFPQWQVQLPLSSTLSLELRTAPADGPWTDWQAVAEYADASDLETGSYSGSGINSGADVHSRAQLRVTLQPSPDGQSPLLTSLALAFIDSSGGPTVTEILAGMPPDGLGTSLTDQSAAGYPRPPIIPRSRWCTAPECDYDEDIQYQGVSHLLIHHTVSNNEITDWAANVRAIWIFHTFTRDWGDIGYNYLIDPNGNIYEGHLGGDNVIGTHAADANRGSMGVALLGTFSSVAPPKPMVDALVELLAWKSDQREIDLWDASKLPLLDWGNLHLSGHRDIYGTTACPGTLAHALIPELRRRVAEKIGFTPTHHYVDDRDAAFTLSDANWHNAPLNCGFNQHAYFTFSTTDPSIAVNQGRWRLDVPIAGRYEVDVFVPFCPTGEPDSKQAPYTVFAADETARFRRDQSRHLGLWMPLGAYNLTPGGVVQLNDLTPSEDDHVIIFDALRYRLLDVAAINVNPSNGEWLTDRAVLFRWQIEGADSLSSLRLQVATDPGFSSLVVDQPVSVSSRQLLYLFDRDYPELYWRLLSINFSGAQTVSSASRFQIDATGPQSRITSIIEQCDGTLTLNWDGSDALSGVAGYTVAFKRPSDADWTTIVANTTRKQANFRPPGATTDMRFRVLAVDRRGNRETDKPNGDVGADAIIPCNIAPPQLITPTDDQWIRDRAPLFRWQIENGSAVVGYRLQVARDSNFNELLLDRPLSADAAELRHRFDNDFGRHFWRVVAETVQGRKFESAARPLQIDATPPTSAVVDVVQLADGSYRVRWQGEDQVSGIAAYRVEFLGSDSSQWMPLVEETTATEAIFTAPDPNAVFRFRSQARDIAGNVEAAKPAGDFSSNNACPFSLNDIDLLAPSPDGWINTRRILFRWQGTPLRCLRNSRLEIALDRNFGSIIEARFFNVPTDNFALTVTGSVDELFWRVIERGVADNQMTSGVGHVRIDSQPPQSQPPRLLRTFGGALQVFANSRDDNSGITRYIFEFREVNSDQWQRFDENERGVALFLPPKRGEIYRLRTRAADAAGNVEISTFDGVTSQQAGPLHDLFLPIIAKE